MRSPRFACPSDACLKPYLYAGDVAQCWLTRGHDGTCEEANAKAVVVPCNGNCQCGEPT